jgi:MinD superfamily P-loop ATPase
MGTKKYNHIADIDESVCNNCHARAAGCFVSYNIEISENQFEEMVVPDVCVGCAHCNFWVTKKVNADKKVDVDKENL